MNPVFTIAVTETFLQLDFDINTRREVKLHQGINRLLGGIKDIQKPLVGTHLKLFPAFLVDVGAPQDTVFIDYRGQGNRTGDPGSGPLCRIDDFTDGNIQQSMIVCFQTDSYLLTRHEKSPVTR